MIIRLSELASRPPCREVGYASVVLPRVASGTPALQMQKALTAVFPLARDPFLGGTHE